MARIRSIKPNFFASEDVSALPLRARLTWVGLWTHCDDQGRAKDNVKLIKAAVWPLDPVSLGEIEEDLITLADHGRIVRYEVDGKRYLAIVNWHDHQKINKPTESKLPAPLPVDNGPRGGTSYPQADAQVSDTWDQNDSRNPPGALPESSRRAPSGKGRERKGEERISPRGRERQAVRHLHDRYGLTDDEASQVITEVQARAREPITSLAAYFDGMAEGDLADIVAAVMDAGRPAPSPPPEPVADWGALHAVPDLPDGVEPAEPNAAFLEAKARISRRGAS